jgi:hypothetical protein
MPIMIIVIYLTLVSSYICTDPSFATTTETSCEGRMARATSSTIHYSSRVISRSDDCFQQIFLLTLAVSVNQMHTLRVALYNEAHTYKQLFNKNIIIAIIISTTK